jgi:hypothetical protein
MSECPRQNVRIDPGETSDTTGETSDTTGETSELTAQAAELTYEFALRNLRNRRKEGSCENNSDVLTAQWGAAARGFAHLGHAVAVRMASSQASHPRPRSKRCAVTITHGSHEKTRRDRGLYRSFRSPNVAVQQIAAVRRKGRST